MKHLSWVSIVRLGLVQMALGSIVVLMISTLNRLMAVELSLPGIIAGALVGFHYAVQITRPNWGYRSDAGGNRTQWIIGGMIALALGAVAATHAAFLISESFVWGLIASTLAYGLIGLGVGAAGTTLLALLATATEPNRRAAAAAIVWLMMIAGFAITSVVVGKMLDPYSPARLKEVIAMVVVVDVLIACVAVWGVERRAALVAEPEKDRVPFFDAMREVCAERDSRNFTIFVFLSMVAYFMQELILEPYAGFVFNYTLGESTKLSGTQNGGVFCGMLGVAIASSGFRIGTLRFWVVAGCISSAFALALLTALGQTGLTAGLKPCVFYLGFSNGVFAVAAIGSMMELAGAGREKREGTRMGLWGASQAIAAGCGTLVGSGAVDLMRFATPSHATAYGTVFAVEALLFLIAAAVAMRVIGAHKPRTRAFTQGEMTCATM